MYGGIKISQRTKAVKALQVVDVEVEEETKMTKAKVSRQAATIDGATLLDQVIQRKHVYK